MGELLIFDLFPALRLYVYNKLDTGCLSCRASIAITKFPKTMPHQVASPSSLMVTPKATESSHSVPSRCKGVQKEGTGDDVGRAEDTKHAPRVGARQAGEDAVELARQWATVDEVVTVAPLRQKLSRRGLMRLQLRKLMRKRPLCPVRLLMRLRQERPPQLRRSLVKQARESRTRPRRRQQERPWLARGPKGPKWQPHRLPPTLRPGQAPDLTCQCLKKGLVRSQTSPVLEPT
jgi:hypothetical protein